MQIQKIIKDIKKINHSIYKIKILLKCVNNQHLNEQLNYVINIYNELIKNIDKYPQATISIYDGKGRKLVEYKANESRGWDGLYNGIRMPSDDYWYEINIIETDEIIVGHFTLIRD